MTEAVQTAIIIATPPTLLALAAVIQSWRTGRAVKEVHVLFNSRLTEWKEETRLANQASNVAAKAEGVKEEKEKHP